jgi:phage gp46-like protein
MRETFTDIRMRHDADGIYDLEFDDEARDLAITAGLETAILCSLFTDRRARSDEVADPWNRRGWIGDLLADRPGDLFGSGIWLYEQARATQVVRASLRLEIIQALQWLQADGMATAIDAETSYDPAKRRVSVAVTVTAKRGGASRHVYDLWRQTKAGVAGTNT